MIGSHNNISVLQGYPLFSKLAEEKAPMVNYEIDGQSLWQSGLSSQLYLSSLDHIYEDNQQM
jgi:hypothetical protein